MGGEGGVRGEMVQYDVEAAAVPASGIGSVSSSASASVAMPEKTMRHTLMNHVRVQDHTSAVANLQDPIVLQVCTEDPLLGGFGGVTRR